MADPIRPAHSLTTRLLLVWALLSGAASAVAQPSEESAGSLEGQLLLTPDVFRAPDGSEIDGERGLFFVKENRANPDSRLIAFHFIRFPAQNATNNSPIFLVPGGPGSEYRFDTAPRIAMANFFSRNQDAVVISQRGNPSSPGLVPNLRFRADRSYPLDTPASVTAMMARAGASYEAGLNDWRERGVDVAGYDIINIVDDVYELRAALGYDKMSLRGCSFGSHFSFSYLKRWPETVDRALLSGVEPIDYGYDSAEFLWKSMERLAAQADADEDLQPFLPEGGLMAALESVYAKLESGPMTVTVPDPASGAQVDVVIGPDDLRMGAIRSLGQFGPRDDTENLTLWPQFILDMYEGDFRVLASVALQSRMGEDNSKLMTLLIDNSLGISEARDAKLLAEEERRFVDPNWWYRSTRELSAAPVIDDAFRADWTIDIPVILVSGDLDWSTPIENAQAGASQLARGKLVTVEGGTHCPMHRQDQLPGQFPQINDQIGAFLTEEFADDAAIDRYITALPDTVTLQGLDFKPADEVNVYDIMFRCFTQDQCDLD
ncbi:MAG: alpha/beta hydrolase [Pseudomonadota bacterium]